jgi:hypothetical protein
MDAATRERLEALERQEQARNSTIVSLEIGELITGVVIELAVEIPTVNGAADKLTLESAEGFRALWVSGTELHEKITKGRFVSEWGDDGLPAEFIELGPVQPGELVSIRRLADKTTAAGRLMQKFAVIRAGAPGADIPAAATTGAQDGARRSGEVAAESAPPSEAPEPDTGDENTEDDGIPF